MMKPSDAAQTIKVIPEHCCLVLKQEAQQSI